jgi:hypothetical protein
MSRIIDIIRRVVHQELARARGSRLGVVTAVFPHTAADDVNNYEVDVRLKHEALELRRVPVAVGHVGLAVPPRVRDLVLVEFVDGDVQQPVITGRFYHANERPPLHRADELVIEHRVPDGTLNQLRFTDDGTIYLQRDVTRPEDNSEARATIRLDGASGDIRITAGEKIIITLRHDQTIEITADGLPITIGCDKLTVDGDVDINGDLKVASDAGSTTISGHEIRGA